MGGMVGPGHDVVKQSGCARACECGSEQRDEVRVKPVVAEPSTRMHVEPPDANVKADHAVRV